MRQEGCHPGGTRAVASFSAKVTHAHLHDRERGQRQMSALVSDWFVLAAAMEAPADHEGGDGNDSEYVSDASVPASRYDTHDDAYDRERGHAEGDKAQPDGRHGRDHCTPCADSGMCVRWHEGAMQNS